jgi:hypothetical protein
MRHRHDATITHVCHHEVDDDVDEVYGSANDGDDGVWAVEGTAQAAAVASRMPVASS